MNKKTAFLLLEWGASMVWATLITDELVRHVMPRVPAPAASDLELVPEEECEHKEQATGPGEPTVCVDCGEVLKPADAGDADDAA